MLTRRYDIDWLRVIAIALLLLYHVAIGFQSWGLMIGFITNSEAWESLWIPMALLNVWRIPLLFFVSGMGVYFALQNRSWKQLLQERTRRIVLPLVVGIFLIVPLHVLLLQYYYQWDLRYTPSPAHLWFLGNIFAYVVLLAPLLIYLKKKSMENWFSSSKNGWVLHWVYYQLLYCLWPRLYSLSPSPTSCMPLLGTDSC